LLVSVEQVVVVAQRFLRDIGTIGFELRLVAAQTICIDQRRLALTAEVQDFSRAAC
jgi:hypothetical protein